MVSVYWNIRTWIALGAAAVALLVAIALTPGYTNSGNMFALVSSFSTLALVACGLAIVMIAGEFDLSIAGVMPLAGLITVKLGQTHGIAVGIIAAIVVSAAVGVVNGYLTWRFAVPSLAVTVGSLVTVTGIGYWVTGGDVVTMPNYQFGLWLDDPIAAVLSPRSIVAFVLIGLAVLLINRTWFGVTTRAVGSDIDRARFSGMPTGRALVSVFVISAVFAGVAGSLQGLSLAAGQPGNNLNFLLQAVTAAIIGGIALTGGKGRLSGVIAGALLLAVLSNAMSYHGAPTAAVQLVSGVILLAILLLDVPLDRLVGRALERVSTKIEKVDHAHV
ncbi:ABC transporter permease [Rhodococcus sp. 06-462-5]|uniref:ABC transporter permease n=1 Tax=Nocardiaceae TaxID=85025 RepID=UPI00050CA469|nr:MULTISPECIES: ABC transporter permease [Rhodococcus]OZC74003.1 ABC transporter permease [Rhodococcus sp. 06-462-5]OZE67999.1 ABC transporter permease [Rhodococcus sp. 02-925g]OZF51980.1 ABC transporter permease [Rhodococcus sp. 14-1411-2a]